MVVTTFIKKLCLFVTVLLFASKAYSQCLSEGYCCSNMTYTAGVLNTAYTGTSVSVTITVNATLTPAGSCTSGVALGVANVDFGDSNSGFATVTNTVHSGPVFITTFTVAHTYTVSSVCTANGYSISACFNDVKEGPSILCNKSGGYITIPAYAPFTVSASLSGCNVISFTHLGGASLQNDTWRFGDGQEYLVPSNGSGNIVHTYTTPGVYTATLTGANVLCPVTLPVTIETPPTVNFTYTVDAATGPCANGAIHLGIQNFTNTNVYTWLINGTSVAATGQNGVYTTGFIPASNTVKLIVAHGTCTNSITQTIILPGYQLLTAPDFNFTLTPSCDPAISSSVNLGIINFSNSPVSYTWSINGTSFGASATNFTNSANLIAGINTINLSQTAGACTTVGTKTLMIGSAGSYTIVATDMGCRTYSFSYMCANGIPALVNPQWAFGDGSLSSVTGASASCVHTFPGGSGSYLVSLAGIGIDPCQSQTVINITDFINPDFGYSIVNLCDASQGVNLTIPGYNTSLYTYTWQINNLLVASTGSTAVYVNNLQQGVNVIKLTITNSSNCSTTVTKIINIGAPNANFDPITDNCVGDNLSIINMSPGGSSYSWQITAPGGSPALYPGMNPMYTYSAAGDYTVILTITTNITSNGTSSVCTSVSDYYTTHVNVIPDATFTTSGISCSNIVTITPTSHAGVDTYTLTYGDGSLQGTSPVVTTSVDPSYLVHHYPITPTYSIYPVTLVMLNGNCRSEYSQNVVMNNSSSLTISAPTPYICRNSGVPLTPVITTNISGAGPYSYHWSGPSSFTSTLAVISATVGGVYQVTVTSSSACSLTLTAGITMTDLAPPSAVVSNITNIDCDHATGSAVLTVPAALSAQGFIVNGFNVVAGNTQCTVNNLIAGLNNITLANAFSPSCYTIVPVTITHGTEPVISVAATQPVSCTGSGSAVLNVSGPGTSSISWFHLESYPVAAFSTATSASALFAGSYIVVHAYHNCVTTANFNIISPVLNLSHVSGPGACPGGSTQVTFSPQFSTAGINTSFSYSVYKLPANTLVAAATPYMLPAGSYNVNVTAGNGCTASHNFVITEIDPINVSLSVTEQGCTTPPGVTATPSGGDGNYTYAWYTNGTANASVLNNLTLPWLTAAVNVSVTVKDGSGCVSNRPAVTVDYYKPVEMTNCNGITSAVNITPCDITACLQYGRSNYTFDWYKQESPQITTEWKFSYDSHGNFIATQTNGGTNTLTITPPSAPGDIDLGLNSDTLVTTVTYPFWDFSGSHATPIFNPAGQLLSLATSTNADNYYSVFEATHTNAETFIASYSGGASTPYSEISDFTSGDYQLYITDAKGCKSTFALRGLVFDDPTPFTKTFSFVWGLERKDPPAVDVNPILHENMIEASNELLDQASACMAKQVKQLNSDLKANCSDLSKFTDVLNVSYVLQENHFTLYYYDRAGRLTKTVPPQGVKTLSSNDILNVKAFRDPASTTTEPTGLPQHFMATTYSYNSFGQLISQNTPDGGTTRFIYDRKNRLRFSQNGQQSTTGNYSYTKYDALGRIVEVGESSNTTQASQVLSFATLTATANYDLADSPSFPSDAANQLNHSITKTVYSDAGPVTYYGKPQRYTQNRVSYTYLDENPAITGDEHYTYYSYDSHGNVEWLVQDDANGIGKNYIAYDYDLVSGKVLKVSYNEKRLDRFYHRYQYDAENRLKKAETSRNGELWDADASYDYYAHGPLKRNTIGEDHVQGLDYIYTLNGWIKSINSPRLSRTNDPGKDDDNTNTTDNPLTRTAADRFGMVLNYYSGDYRTNRSNFLTETSSDYSNMGTYDQSGAAPYLYNGNISSWVQSQLDITGTTATDARADLYNYDILNRIKTSTSLKEGATAGSGWANLSGGNTTYKTNYSYDANGNILSLKRYDDAGLAMDDLSYTYDNGAGAGAKLSNTLSSVTDAIVSTVADRGDLQDTHTYVYDKIGNLTQESGQELRTIAGVANTYFFTTNISWNVYGKIRSIVKQTTDGGNFYDETINFEYDAAGNRVKKEYWKDYEYDPDEIATPKEITTTWYVRDAQGNPMATYQRYYDLVSTLFKIDLVEQPIYGSERIGENVQKLTLASAGNFNDLAMPANGYATISEYQNWITTTSKTQLLPGGISGTDNLCQCKVVSLNGTHYQVASDATQFLGIAGNGVAVAEDLNRNLQFFVVLAKSYLGGADACLVFDKDGHLMKGTQSITSVSPDSKPIIVNIPGTKQYAVVTLNALKQPVYHVIDMALSGYSLVSGDNKGEVTQANNALSLTSPANSKHGLHFTGTEDHIIGHAMVYANRYTPDPIISSQGTTDILAYDFGTSTLTPASYTLHTVYGCANTEAGQMQISPDGTKLAWWRYTRQLAGFTARNGELVTLPLTQSRTALSGPVTTQPIRPAGNFGNGMLEFMKNSSDLLFSQRGVYKDGNNQASTTKYDRNVWKYTPINLSSINPSASPMISYLFGEIKRGVDGNFYIPQMGASRDQIHSYSGSGFNSDVNAGDTAYKLASALPTQVYKVFADHSQDPQLVRTVGNKDYELKDHLGNVRVVISDTKLLAYDGTSSFNTGLQFFPEVKNYTDYYAFGSPMPGRSYVSGDSYRYGFNGKENDNEVSGNGNTQDYGMRIYDTRLGRFFSVDPLRKDYPELTPYQFASNNPIQNIDFDGLEGKPATKSNTGQLTDAQDRTYLPDRANLLKPMSSKQLAKQIYENVMAGLGKGKSVGDIVENLEFKLTSYFTSNLILWGTGTGGEKGKKINPQTVKGIIKSLDLAGLVEGIAAMKSNITGNMPPSIVNSEGKGMEKAKDQGKEMGYSGEGGDTKEATKSRDFGDTTIQENYYGNSNTKFYTKEVQGKVVGKASDQDKEAFDSKANTNKP